MLSKTVLLIAPILLTSCSKKNSPIPVDKFQEIIEKLEVLYYETCSIQRHGITQYFYNSEDYQYTEKKDNQANYHYDNNAHDWVLVDGDMRLVDAYKPQTLRGMNMEEIMDTRYEYTFYVNPFKVHMYRTYEYGPQETFGDYTYDWKFDKDGYLTYIHFHENRKDANAENDYVISDYHFYYTYA